MQEFAFDLSLTAAIRIKADNEDEARRALLELLDCADTNFGAFPNGDPIPAEASAVPESLRVFEIDGEPHHGGNYHDPAAWLERATNLLAESLDKWEDEEESVKEEKADHIAELNQFFEEWQANKPPPQPAASDAAQHRLQSAQIAAAHIKQARIELRKAGANAAADYAARALKSAEGAVRHARRLVGESQRARA